MCAVGEAKLGSDSAKLDQLVGIAVRVRVVGHTGGKADRALLQPLSQHALRTVHIRAPERNVPHAYGGDADRAVADKGGNVARGLEVVVAEESVDGRHVQVLRRKAEDPRQVFPIHQVVVVRQGRVGEAVRTEDLRRDALPNAVGVLAVEEKSAVRMGVHVDKAGRDRQPRRIDHPVGLRFRQVADRSDLFTRDPDICPHARRPGAVDHGTAGDDRIEVHCRSLS